MRQRQTDAATDIDVCMTEGCGRVPHARGLCKTCYHQVRRAVVAGEATWLELEAFGVCGRPRRRGRRPGAAYLAAVAAGQSGKR